VKLCHINCSGPFFRHSVLLCSSHDRLIIVKRRPKKNSLQ